MCPQRQSRPAFLPARQLLTISQQGPVAVVKQNGPPRRCRPPYKSAQSGTNRTTGAARRASASEKSSHCPCSWTSVAWRDQRLCSPPLLAGLVARPLELGERDVPPADFLRLLGVAHRVDLQGDEAAGSECAVVCVREVGGGHAVEPRL